MVRDKQFQKGRELSAKIPEPLNTSAELNPAAIFLYLYLLAF